MLYICLHLFTCMDCVRHQHWLYHHPSLCNNSFNKFLTHPSYNYSVFQNYWHPLCNEAHIVK